MTAFALAYRPVRFADVVAQSHIKPVLRAMVSTGRVPPVLLFSGPRGTGKTSVARILAAALNCEEPKDGDACATCDSCLAVQATNSVAVIEVDAATSGGADDVRALKEMVGYSTASDWRVVLLDEAHSMSRAAFNALLKVLEEPPPQTVFVLLTTEVVKIPDTVVSRSQRFEFRRLTPGDIQNRLRLIADAESLQVPDELLVEIALRSEGGMRDAVMTLDQLSYVEVRDVAAYREMFGFLDIAAPLVKAALDMDARAGFGLIEDYFSRVGDPMLLVSDLVVLVRDLMLLMAGAEPTAPSELLQALAERIEPDRLVAVVRVLWELKPRARPTEADPRSQVEMAFVLLSDALVPRQEPQPIPQGTAAGSERMSIEEMVKMMQGPS